MTAETPKDAASAARSQVIECGHQTCRLPAFEVRNGCLMVLNKHSGQHHINFISLEAVKRLLEEANKSAQDAA